jgi:predicted transcriptional regulator
MERLRHKGYLRREKVEGIFRYWPSEPHEQQLRGLVRRFFEQSLGGSLDPFVTYLAEDAHLTPEQLEQLKQLVRELDAKGLDAKGSSAEER